LTGPRSRKPIQSEFGWEIGGLPDGSKTPIQNAFGWETSLDGDGWGWMGQSAARDDRHPSPHTPSKRVLDGVGWAFGWGRMGAQSPSKPIQNRFGWGLDGPSGLFWMCVSSTWRSPEVRP